MGAMRLQPRYRRIVEGNSISGGHPSFVRCLPLAEDRLCLSIQLNIQYLYILLNP